MRKVIIHCGMPKTGTTSLQAYLRQDAKRLGKMDLHYPEPPEETTKPTGVIKARHGFIEEAWLAGQLAQVITSVLSAAKGRDLILSNESFYRAFFCQDDGFFSELSRALGDCEISLVLYLRRQDLWLESFYGQNIKANLWPKLVGQPLDFVRFIDEERKLLDYHGNITSFQQRNPSVKLIVRLYEQPQLLHGDICADFYLNVLNLITPPSSVSRQKSLDKKAAFMLSECAPYTDPDQRKTLIRLLNGFSEDKQTATTSALIAPKVLRKAHLKYHLGNKKLCEEFRLSNDSQFANQSAYFEQHIKTQITHADWAQLQVHNLKYYSAPLKAQSHE